MKKSFKIKHFLVMTFLVLSLAGCKEYYIDGGLTSTEPLPYNSLEYMKTRMDIFDTTIMILELSGLKDVIAKESHTFFLPQNASISRLMLNVNKFRKDSIAKIDYDKDTVLITDITAETWRKYLSRYILSKQYLRDDIKQGKQFTTGVDPEISGGETVKTYDGFEMVLFRDKTSWENVSEAGPAVIYLAHTHKGHPKKKLVTAKVTSSDIRTTNGVIHVLSKGHEFAFNESDNFLPRK